MADLLEPKRGRGTYPPTPPCVRKPPRRTGWWSGCCCMARRWSSVRRVADVRCGMRVTPTPHMRVTHRCAAAEGSAGEGGFFSTRNEGDRSLHTRSYTRSPRVSPCERARRVDALLVARELLEVELGKRVQPPEALVVHRLGLLLRNLARELYMPTPDHIRITCSPSTISSSRIGMTPNDCWFTATRPSRSRRRVSIERTPRPRRCGAAPRPRSAAAS